MSPAAPLPTKPRRASAPGGGVSIRSSRDADALSLSEIYSRHVLLGTGTFELEAPAPAEMARRRAEVLAQGWPWLVAEHGGRVVGFAYAGDFRPRPAYRFCVEDAVYVDADFTGLGVGSRLLAELIAQCEAAGARQMVALIGDSANAASIGLHRAAGFRDAGVMSAVGWKLGRWLDVVLLQRSLGPGNAAAPEGRP